MPAKKARPTETRGRGRPSLYTDELAAEIVDRLSGGETLADICRDDHMPDPSTVWKWRGERNDFFQSIARARDIGYDAIAARSRRTARGKTEVEGGDSQGDVQRDKLIIETDLKLLAKWDPRRYGEKVQTEVSGELNVRTIKRVIVRPGDPDS